MPQTTTFREHVLTVYLFLMSTRDQFMPLDFQDHLRQFCFDTTVLLALLQTRYLQPRYRIPKYGNLHTLAWAYAENSWSQKRFVDMLRVTPRVFNFLLTLIENHPVFFNNSNTPQTPVEQQLAVTLYRLGHYGNAASLRIIARTAGVAEGSKEVEKCWIDERLGFRGTWREGWVMYDGTIVPLFRKPGLNGDAYFTRKSNYGLNLQV
ncbi:hypothetical protein K435DRAFT_661587 [Dendrothele bispora CBS 962.96]|uniref:DDE Tnp4 domain-containing protein n=1 Tax=Dendrothele bispora (strain CBS 962.96) TaxID=1314807 RepID=A0A4S8M725_DENBC|nr:hypothetical protein K435DRAFT_661587 [Dendrothele bispora CBS 962.96]